MIRTLPLLVLGFWLGILVASWVMASVNFRTVDRVLGPAANPEMASRLQPVAPDDRRAALRYLVAEINRWMFRGVGVAQIALGAVLVAGLWTAGGLPRALAVIALLAVLVQMGVVGPAIASLGRDIDFQPRPLPEAIGRRFGALHGAYVLLDLGKAALLVALAGRVSRGVPS